MRRNDAGRTGAGHLSDSGATKGLRRLSGTTLTEATARRVLAEVCGRVALDPAGAELVRLGSNAVFRLAEPVIVRIAGDGASLEEVRRQVLVARWLEEVGYPATRALDVEQPVQVGEYVATFLVSVSDRDEYAPIRRGRRPHPTAARTRSAVGFHAASVTSVRRDRRPAAGYERS